MSRPKIDPWWVARAKTMLAEMPGRSAKSIELSLSHQAQLMKPPRNDWPRERSIRRINEGLSEADRQQYARFHWPESMEAGLLPYAASRPLLELLRYTQRFHTRPTVRLARWYWNVYQAAPDAPLLHLHQAAAHLAGYEVATGAIPDTAARAVEGWLAYQPWTEEGGPAYEEAIEKSGLPDLRGAMIEGVESGKLGAVLRSLSVMPEWGIDGLVKHLETFPIEGDKEADNG